MGVNLQSANIIINLYLPWNPAVLDQRIGRIYRLGQKKHIQVYNFIARNSIEHRILYLLDFKRAVFNGVLEQEGNDEVMLEGFMESVKAMTSVDLNSDPVSTSSGKICRETENGVITKGNSDTIKEGSLKNDQHPSTVVQEYQDNTERKSIQNLFTKIRLRIKSFLKIFMKKAD